LQYGVPRNIVSATGKVSIIFYRWKVVVHGGIDGFYWTIVYLKCSNDNKSFPRGYFRVSSALKGTKWQGWHFPTLSEVPTEAA